MTSDHCTNDVAPGGCLNGGSGGTITVTEVGNTLQFDVNLATGVGIINGGFNASIGFNLSGNLTITYSNVTPGFDVVGGNPQSAGNLHMDGTGFFEYGLSCNASGPACTGPGGGGAYFGNLTFTISDTNLTLASLEKNADGQYFALDVIGPTGNTGAIDASSINPPPPPPPPVPEPASLVLLGSALLGFGLLRRRKA